ncbi:hypothetical protein HCH52_12085 [Oscillospiraceae bacterium HV4-5-C5C]|nr:hypothetical protein [Oscillospiraceae bacterium HV4-5-C5C]
MKKIIGVASTLLFVIVLTCSIFVSAAITPNYATNNHEDMSIYYYGYVQCQPSYVEAGKHAARGYIRYRRYNLLGEINADTGRLWTEYGQSPRDSRILSRNHTFTDSIVPNPYKTEFFYDFEWVPDNGSWPFSQPPVIE